MDTAVWLPDQARYRKLMSPNYYQFKDGVQAMTKGVKIHVSALPKSAQALAQYLLPQLIAWNVFHKILADTDLIAKAAEDNQKRKLITVYPQTPDDMETMAEGLDRMLMRRECPLPVGHVAACLPIDGDLGWGKSGYVFIRHGFYDKDDLSDDRAQVSQQLKDYLMKGKTDDLFIARPKRRG